MDGLTKATPATLDGEVAQREIEVSSATAETIAPAANDFPAAQGDRRVKTCTVVVGALRQFAAKQFEVGLRFTPSPTSWQGAAYRLKSVNFPAASAPFAS